VLGFTATQGTVSGTLAQGINRAVGMYFPAAGVATNNAVTLTIPRYLLRSGINGTTFYVAATVNLTSAGTLQFIGSYVAERLDSLIGTPV